MVSGKADLYPLRAGIDLYSPAHAASNRGSRARLQAAIVRVHRAPTRLTPRSIVCAIGPTV